MRPFSIVLASLVVFSASDLLSAQTPANAAFEVTSIKRNVSGAVRVLSLYNKGDRFSVFGITLRQLVVYAYRMPNERVLGGPAWTTSERWDIEAKAEEGWLSKLRTGQNEQELKAIMIQSLLEDRFKLKARREKKDTAVFQLVVMRGGPKIPLSSDQGPPKVATPSEISKMKPEDLKTLRGVSILSTGRFHGIAVSMEELTKHLSGMADRPVVDMTGLKGLYDIRLQWTPDGVKTPGPPSAVAPGSTPLGPSLFTAIQEQLGLRLVSAKSPVEVIVIADVQKPSPN